MRISFPTLRNLVVAGSLSLVALAAPAAALADAGPTSPTPLQRGASVSGTLNNPGGATGGSGGVNTYTVMGDGNSITLNATWDGVSDPSFASSAVLTVWGPLGSVAMGGPSAASPSDSLTFPTVQGQSYTVVIAAYQPILQSNFTLAVS